MTISARMQALIEKIDAADVAHFAGLRALTVQQAEQRARRNAEKKQAARRRAADAVRLVAKLFDEPPSNAPTRKKSPRPA